MVAISIEYRLLNRSTGTTVFDCVRDGRAAVRYVRQYATELGIDPQQITVAGCSAGGHVAVGTALFDEVDEESDAKGISSMPNAMVLYYPVIDTSADGYGQKKIGDNWKQISPVHNVKPGLPPTIVFHGTGDTVTPFSGAKSFHEKMQSAGNDCELISHEGGSHGYLIFELPLFEAAMKRTQEFLQAKGLLPANEVADVTSMSHVFFPANVCPEAITYAEASRNLLQSYYESLEHWGRILTTRVIVSLATNMILNHPRAAARQTATQDYMYVRLMFLSE